MNRPVHARVITEPLGGSALSRAVQSRGLPAAIQPWTPATRSEWTEHAARVRSAHATTNWADALAAALAASGNAAARLARVAAGHGIVVTTGQQAGLFGGPLYTLNKALTALALADRLEHELGVPTLPVFWAATDDADFAEAAVAHVADADGLHELRLSAAPPPGTPMADAPLADVEPLVAQLRAACGSAAHPDFFTIAADSFRQAPTVGDAYVRMLRGLLAPMGIAVLDASHPAHRAAARPLLLDALRLAPDVARAGSERVAALEALGFEPQVRDDRGLSLVFAIESGVKRRIPIDKAAAYAREAGKSSDLVPNVLLRPVVERELLPTVAYVAGPGELAYFAQSGAVAAALHRPAPVGVARWSCTVVESFAQRALSRLDVEYGDMADVHAVERRMATAALPEDVAIAWERLQQRLGDAMRELATAVNASALMPPAVIDGLERSIGHRLSRAERRLLAASKRRDDQVRRDIRVASAALYPLGKRQERVLNYVPMLTRGGGELLDAMVAAARDHAATLIGVERAQPVAAR